MPPIDAMSAVDRWERFIYDYPKRDWRFPHNEQAAQFLTAELEAAGYQTRVLEFTVRGALVNAGGVSHLTDAPAKVIWGSRAGAEPSRHFALMAHYDTVTVTTMGAYDDASGTMVELDACKLLAAVPTRHTIDCFFFDAEERGLLASKAFVEAWHKGQFGDFGYDMAFGYDMTGINWPGYKAWDLYAMVGTQTRGRPDLENLTDPLHAFLEITLRRFLDEGPAPGARDGVTIVDVSDRNSDEQSFMRAGIPVVRITGGRNGADYPQYHGPLDTPSYIYQFVGGKDVFARGYAFAIEVAYYTILGLDRVDLTRLDVVVD